MRSMVRIFSGINVIPLPDTTHLVIPCHELTAAIPPPHAKVISGGLPKNCLINLIPGLGFPQEDYQLPNPMATFSSPTHGRYNNYPEQGHRPSPPVLAV